MNAFVAHPKLVRYTLLACMVLIGSAIDFGLQKRNTPRTSAGLVRSWLVMTVAIFTGVLVSDSLTHAGSQ